MVSKIDEIVEVLVAFKKNIAFPKIIKWNNRVYKIEKFNMRHEVMEGNVLMHYFSVSDNANFFKLVFNTKSLQWKLAEVYSEG